jgi:integrase
MATPKGPNKMAKGEGSVYLRTSDNRWCGTLSLPDGPNGERRRKTVTAKTEKEALKKLADERKQLRAHGDIPTKTQTFGSWANVWFESIAVKKVRPRTAATYRTYLEQYILPVIGDVQLVKLTPAHVRRVHAFVDGKGLSSTTVLQAHRIIAVCLKYAEREGRVSSNVANLTDAPLKARKTLAVLTAEDGVKVLQTVAGERLGSRWAAALLTGARQGELLGLELDRVTDVLDVSWQLQRLSWEHGCKTPCKKARAADCPDKKITTPGNWESRRLDGGLWLARPKTSRSERLIQLVDPLRSIIEQRISVAATEPNPHGLMWTADPKANRSGILQPLDGSPIDPSRDNKAWHDVLARAGVKDARLHDARHTTASLLLKAGVPERVIMQILGHSTYVVTRQYQDVDVEQLTAAMKALSSQIS